MYVIHEVELLFLLMYHLIPNIFYVWFRLLFDTQYIVYLISGVV